LQPFPGSAAPIRLPPSEVELVRMTHSVLVGEVVVLPAMIVPPSVATPSSTPPEF
jgi:hypothetical protein